MSRVDVHRLNVPAEFAAIFERAEAQPPAEPETPAAPQPIQAAPIYSLTDSMQHSAPPVRTAAAKCPKCTTAISAVEMKMGRCLTCNTVFAGGTVSVGI